VSFKHQKTIEDLHKTTIVQIKFIGDFSKEIVVISSDITGLICITTFSDGMIFFGADKEVFMNKRLGATYSLSPLI